MFPVSISSFSSRERMSNSVALDEKDRLEGVLMGGRSGDVPVQKKDTGEPVTEDDNPIAPRNGVATEAEVLPLVLAAYWRIIERTIFMVVFSWKKPIQCAYNSLGNELVVVIWYGNLEIGSNGLNGFAQMSKRVFAIHLFTS